MDKNDIKESYEIAKKNYSKWGIDTDDALKKLEKIRISIHCWQGDDVSGFENPEGKLTGGIQATGNYPGKARNENELMEDLDEALSMIPGKHKLNLHAIYLENNGLKVERDRIEPKNFKKWVDWAKKRGMGLDFNPTIFSHPLTADGFTLSSSNENVRKFWIRHCKASRKIGEYFGKELGIPCITNIWIPDGYKDIPVDRYSPRQRLKESLDEIFEEDIDEKYNIDSIESKLFGIGSESYVVGSHEFYLSYAMKNNKCLCLDSGHFHPTEVISDKISSILTFSDKLLLHVSRPVRWDSDHVVIYNDELVNIARQVVNADKSKKIYIALDFFDASINRLAAWIIGTRNMLKALLYALLEPYAKLKVLELSGDLTSRLGLMEEFKTYPYNSVWNYYCMKKDVPIGEEWLTEIKRYEKDVLSKRKIKR